MRVQLRKILHRLRDESGQSLIVVVSSMTVLLAMAGFGIDTASWMVKHHHDQVVADAAALAAANCLANPGEAGSNVTINGTVTALPSCASGKDATDATIVAVDYAAANGLTITDSQVTVDTSDGSTGQVTVNASNGSKSIFAELFGIDNTTQSASSIAGWKSTSNSCSTPGQNCDFMFANSNNCSTGSYVLIVSTQGASTVNGNIQTNGSLEASATGNAGGINGQGTYGNGTGCTTTFGGNQNPWNTSPPPPGSEPLTWPIDYSTDFPACTGTGGSNPCQSQSGRAPGFPSFCTNGNTNPTGITFTGANGDDPIPGNVYCAAGTGDPANPSSWNGAISINSSGNNTWDDTYVAGTINYSGAGGDTLSSCGYTAGGYSNSICSAPKPATPNYPLFYAVEQDPNATACAAGTSPSTNCALSVSSNGNLSLYGDVFIQKGTANLNFQGNQSAGDTFIEANVIAATMAGNFNGDGPTLNGSDTPIPGSDSLVG